MQCRLSLPSKQPNRLGDLTCFDQGLWNDRKALFYLPSYVPVNISVCNWSLGFVLQWIDSLCTVITLTKRWHYDVCTVITLTKRWHYDDGPVMLCTSIFCRNSNAHKFQSSKQNVTTTKICIYVYIYMYISLIYVYISLIFDHTNHLRTKRRPLYLQGPICTAL